MVCWVLDPFVDSVVLDLAAGRFPKDEGASVMPELAVLDVGGPEDSLSGRLVVDLVFALRSGHFVER